MLSRAIEARLISRSSSSFTVFVNACCIFSLLAAKSTAPSSGGFLGLLSLVFLGLPLSVPENFSTARALEAEVDALETGCRGLELRSGGDFLGRGAEIYAVRRGDVEGRLLFPV